MDEAVQDIYKEFNVTEEFVAEWLNRFKGDKEIQAEFDLLKKIADLVFDPKEGKYFLSSISNLSPLSIYPLDL